jgi:hypothetical protein
MIGERLAGGALLALLSCGLSFGVEAKSTSESCNQHQIFNDDEGVTARAEEDFSVPFGGSALKVIAHKNGGVSVRGADVSQYQVHVCKVARAMTQSEAEQMLSQIHVQNSGGVLQPQGPESSHWVAFLIIDAPRTAPIDVETKNGPASFRDLAGAVNVRATNGPVTLKRVSGDVTAEVQNGPIAFNGSGGNIKLTSKNGPLSVKLEGESWSGTGLEAVSTNGPLSVSLPKDFQSGVEIEANGWSPVECSAKGCESAQRVQAGRVRKITFGSGNAIVHISTQNGPVSVSNTKAEY